MPRILQFLPTVRIALLALAVLLALVTIAPARAATISYSLSDGGTVIYVADPGETLQTRVGYQAGCTTNGDCVTFYGDAAPTLAGIAASACFPSGGGETSCMLDNDLSRTGVRVVGGDAHDHLSVYDVDLGGFPANTPYPIELLGGAGNDVLVGGNAGETLHGGPGADQLIGGGGSDVLYGDDGNDVLRGDGYLNGNSSSDGGSDRLYGGAGDDTLTGDSTNDTARIGSDLLDGGPGNDTVTDDWYRSDGSGGNQDPSPTVSFDGVANDGRPGEGDNVVNVERIDTGYLPNQASPVTLAGSPGADTFNLVFAHGSVSGGAGDDVITGSDDADVLDGGPGNDKVSGGFGDDVITGGPGQDDIGGDRTAACFYGPIYGTCTIGTGNDTIHAQDGERDTIDCGPGSDTAYVDAIDVVVGCEQVIVANAPPPTDCGASCPPGKATVLPRAPTAKPSITKKLRLRTIARTRAIPVVCRIAGAGKCRVKITIAAKDAKRLHLKVKKRAKSLTLGTKTKTFKKKGRARLKVKLSRKTARALRRTKRLRVTITATSTAAKHRARTTTIHREIRR